MVINVSGNDKELPFGGINENAASRRAERNHSKKSESQMKNGSIFTGNLNVNQDNILLKKQHAQKKAMKVVGDAWNNDKKIDDDLEERRQHIRDLTEEANSTQKELNTLNEDKSKLRENFGVSEDSQEQRDLELLRKDRQGFTMTEEERKRLKEIQQNPLTDYQSTALKYDENGEVLKKRIDDATAGIQEETSMIRGIKLARLKTHPMVDAQGEADTIMNEASKEIMNMLIDEGKEHVDEEMKENEEAAEEKTQEKEEQEEKVEERNEEKEKQEAFTNNKEDYVGSKSDEDLDSTDVQQLTEYNQIKKTVEEEVKEIVDSMNLLDEDLKGAVIDSQL